MNAMFDNFTAEELRNFKAKNSALVSIEELDNYEFRRQQQKQEKLRSDK